MEKISKELIAASTVPLILGILKSGDDYGYRIIKQVERLSSGKLQWKEGSLYPVLNKLEQKGFIESYIVLQNGRNRKFYTLKEIGKSHLEDLKGEWEILNKTMQQLWIRPALT